MKRYLPLFFPVLVLACALAQGQTDLEQLRARAEAGDLPAQLSLARTYFLGIGIPKDQGEALRWFRKAADRGEPQSERILGLLYETAGAGLARDDKQAVYWYGRAAEHGNAPAQAKLGQMYENGAGGLPQDASRAVSWYLKAASQDDATAENDLGRMYEQGRGVAKNEADALSWYRKAGEHGNASALNNAARLCITSSNPEVRDPNAGLIYSRQAVGSNPNNPAFLQTLARAYSLEGQLDDAVRTQLEALARVSPDQKKEYQQALDEYQSALSRSQGAATPSAWTLPRAYEPNRAVADQH